MEESLNIHDMLREQLAQLPAKLQKAIRSTEVSEKLRTISQKHRLHIDQGQILENETYMVLLGLEPASDYQKNIKRELRVSDEDAANISKEVRESIFLSVRDALKALTDGSGNAEERPRENIEQHIEKEVAAPTSPPKNTSSTPPKVQPQRMEQSVEGDKFSSIVKHQNKEITLTPTPSSSSLENKKGYTVDPYREPIE